MPGVVVDDLTRDDLERGAVDWSGSPSHLRNVALQLDRRDRGVLDYLVLRVDGVAVCKGAVDYEEFPGAGELMQLATDPEREGQGHATRLIEEAERRIAGRGLHEARLSVEPGNERALRLYRHLGYEPVGERTIGWETDDGWYSTRVVDLRKTV